MLGPIFETNPQWPIYRTFLGRWRKFYGKLNSQGASPDLESSPGLDKTFWGQTRCCFRQTFQCGGIFVRLRSIDFKTQFRCSRHLWVLEKNRLKLDLQESQWVKQKKPEKHQGNRPIPRADEHVVRTLDLKSPETQLNCCVKRILLPITFDIKFHLSFFKTCSWNWALWALWILLRGARRRDRRAMFAVLGSARLPWGHGAKVGLGRRDHVHQGFAQLDEEVIRQTWLSCIYWELVCWLV